MKRILLPLLLLFAFAANAQIKLFYQLMAGPYEFTYTNIPSRPTLGTSATLTYSAPGNILNTTGGDTQDKILSGAWTEFHAFSFTGSAGTNRRISNENSSTVIGSVANHLFTKEGTGSTYFELNGKSSTEPLYFDDVGAVSATSAIQLTADAAGPYAYITNIVNDARGYAVFANTAGTLSGGNSTTPTTSSTNYQDLSISYVRSFNATGNKEHLYLGATTTNTYAIHQNIDISHCLGYQSEWDGMQIQNAINFTVDHVTIVDAGSDGTASQDANIQVQNSYGSVTNSIFTGAPQGFRFSTFNLTFTNNYVQWDGNKANEIIGYYTNYASTNRLMVDPTTVEILIDGCDFVATTWTGALMDVQDANVNITVQNCRIQGPTSLFSDSRGGSPTGTLTDGGGNTFVGSGTIPAPTFSNFTATDFDGHGLLTEQTHHQANRGYRTQN